MIKKIIKYGVVAAFAILVAGWFGGNEAYADGYYGTGSGSGGVSGCSSGALSTCYGATWRKYEWPDGQDSITIPGRGEGSQYAYAATTTITGKCAKSNGGTGYYWRYAMVASKDYNYGNGVTVKKGDQVGLVGINGNANSVYNSEFFGGAMNYIGPKYGEVDWGDVQKAYEKARKEYPEIYKLAWGETDANGGIAWFCAPESEDVEYYALSNVANSKVGGYSTTGINGGSLKTVYTTTANVAVNESINVTFSHNIYGSVSSKDVAWGLTRTGLNSTGNYTADLTSSAVLQGNANLTVYEDGYYAAENRPGSDGASSFIARDVYKITFNREGSYEFCEMVGVKGKNLTKVCTKVVVGSSSNGTCGDGTLGTYVNGTTSVLSRAINQRLTSTYRGWLNQTYAKPGDTIAWKNCYFPGAQAYANTMVSKFVGNSWDGDGQENVCYDTWNQQRKMTVLYAATYGHSWTNEFHLTTNSPYGFNNANLSNNGSVTTYDKTLSNGDTTTTSVDNNYAVAAVGDVGRKFTDKITTPGTPVRSSVTTDGRGYHTWWFYNDCTCCGCKRWCDDDDGGCCECDSCHHEHYNYYYIGSTSDGERKDESSISIPYNFNNTASVDLSLTSTNSKDAVYAGETVRVVNPTVNVGVRENMATEDTYATEVHNAQVRMVAYVTTNPSRGSQLVSGNAGSNICNSIVSGYYKNGMCQVVKEVNNTTLNENGDLNGTTYVNNVRGTAFNGIYDVYDASAGDYFCVAMTVFPATSGSDTNWEKPEGDGNWYVSQPSCKIIAKKPTMQVLGGSFYTSGSVSTLTSAKRNFYGVSQYNGQGGVPVYFGSMVEESLVSNGIVTGMASGMALGGGSSSRIGSGALNNNFCERWATMGIANYTDGSVVDGLCPGFNAAGLANINTETLNRQALADYFAVGQDTGVAGSDNFGSYTIMASGTGKEIRYSDVGNVTIYSGTVGQNVTRIVRSSGDVTIDGSIYYNGGPYTAAGRVPKTVIYANGNISISCYVSRVDAILVAGGTVDTCYQAAGTSEEDAIRSQNQLVINGAVIANKMEVPRTYGTATGYDTVRPAEVINYDTSALIWGQSMADAGESDTLTVTYQHELAPRY